MLERFDEKPGTVEPSQPGGRGAGLGADAACLAAVLVGCTLLSCAETRGKGDRWIDEVRLQGTNQLSRAKILSGLETQSTPWYAWLPWVHYQWFDPASLDMDIKC